MLRSVAAIALTLLFSAPAIAAPEMPAPPAAQKTPSAFEAGKAAYDKKDWITAIKNLRPLAEAGDDRAMILLGNMYEQGLGVFPNPLEAMKLYKAAAVLKNNSTAMVAISAMYIESRGVDTNYNTALQWAKRAALLGDQQGALVTAILLSRGNRVAQDRIMPDTREAYKWFRIAEHAKGSEKISAAAKTGAEGLAKKRLRADDVAAADREIADFKPADPKTLGPPPADPIAAPPKAPDPAARPKRPSLR